MLSTGTEGLNFPSAFLIQLLLEHMNEGLFLLQSVVSFIKHQLGVETEETTCTYKVHVCVKNLSKIVPFCLVTHSVHLPFLATLASMVIAKQNETNLNETDISS